MREILMATSALMLLSTGMGFAQDPVNPGTGQFEAQDLGDEPTPEFADPNDRGTTADVDVPAIQGQADQELLAQQDCVRAEPGTGQFEPSDSNDEPRPDFVETDCPEGMVPRDTMATGAIEGDDEVDPGTGQFEPTNTGDEPTPDFVDPEATVE